MEIRDATERTVILAVGGTFGAAPVTGSRYTNNKTIKRVETTYRYIHTDTWRSIERQKFSLRKLLI